MSVMWTSGILVAALLPIHSSAAAQAVTPGRWDVAATVTEISVQGVPGFLLRMLKGRTKTEKKCIAPQQAASGIASLLAPDPKAGCRIEASAIADGRYAQTMICPHKKGGAMRITRSGTYSVNGFEGIVRMEGQTPKGPIIISLAQRAARTSAACRRANG